jgi:G-patch domain
MALLPDIPTLETQARIPIEGFGMGVLLGLSWKPAADLQGNKIDLLKDRRQRPTALGLVLEDEEFLRIDPLTGEGIKGRKRLLWNPLKKIDKLTRKVVGEGKSRKKTAEREQTGRDLDWYRRRDRYLSGKRSESRPGRTKDGGNESKRQRDREGESDMRQSKVEGELVWMTGKKNIQGDIKTDNFCIVLD